MKSKQGPEIIRFMKKSKKWNLMKTQLDRLGHHKSADFPLKNHKKSCLQSKHVFWCFKWQKISKSDPKWSPNGENPLRFINIHPGTFQGPSQCICDPLDCKMIPKWCPRTSKWSQNGHPRTLKVNENQQAPTTNYVTKRCIFWLVLHWFQSWKSFKSC